MMTSNNRMRALVFATALAALLLIFLGIARPWYLRWGATDEELTMPLASDAIVPGATSSSMRAITINASAEKVWEWLAQTGQDRGGFFSYDILENVLGSGMPTEDVLRPEKSQWQLGDKLWMYPPDKAGGAGFATLRTYVPLRELGFGTRMVGTSLAEPENGSWSFALLPLDANRTRLLMRGRGASGRSPGEQLFDVAIFEPAHFAMERRMMIGIKQLAEGEDRNRVANHMMVGLWTITLILFFTAATLVWKRSRWELAAAAVLAAGLVFQALTFLQPPLIAGLILTMIPALLLWWPRRLAQAALAVMDALTNQSNQPSTTRNPIAPF
jgi:hypothetical protein